MRPHAPRARGRRDAIGHRRRPPARAAHPPAAASLPGSAWYAHGGAPAAGDLARCPYSARYGWLGLANLALPLTCNAYYAAVPRDAAGPLLRPPPPPRRPSKDAAGAGASNAERKRPKVETKG